MNNSKQFLIILKNYYAPNSIEVSSIFKKSKFYDDSGTPCNAKIPEMLEEDTVNISIQFLIIFKNYYPSICT